MVEIKHPSVNSYIKTQPTSPSSTCLVSSSLVASQNGCTCVTPHGTNCPPHNGKVPAGGKGSHFLWGRSSIAHLLVSKWTRMQGKYNNSVTDMVKSKSKKRLSILALSLVSLSLLKMPCSDTSLKCMSKGCLSALSPLLWSHHYSPCKVLHECPFNGLSNGHAWIIAQVTFVLCASSLKAVIMTGISFSTFKHQSTSQCVQR